jgi:hypothetical protein
MFINNVILNQKVSSADLSFIVLLNISTWLEKAITA